MDRSEREKRERPEDAVDLAIPPEKNSVEEEQMEKFFALLKNIREVRSETQRSVLGASVPVKRKKVEEAAWIPTFQLEDFALAPVRGGRPSVSALSKAAEGDGSPRKETTDAAAGLDLKLSL